MEKGVKPHHKYHVFFHRAHVHLHWLFDIEVYKQTLNYMLFKHIFCHMVATESGKRIRLQKLNSGEFKVGVRVESLAALGNDGPSLKRDVLSAA